MKKLFLFSLACLSLFFSSCEDDKNARIEVWLTDDPGDYQKVNIDLQEVQVHSNETESEQGWKSVEVTPRIYNLLDLANGTETLLGDLDLPGGRLSQIRLKLGENNSVQIDGVEHPLSTPSAQQSGLKVKINKVLAEGITYKILLDFDAAQSVVKTGNDAYILKPVIRAITEAQDGGIEGMIDPPGQVSISVLSGEEIVTTTTSSDEGEFLIQGLEAGTYSLVFDGPGDDPVVEKDGIEVVLGEITDVGVVSVPE